MPITDRKVDNLSDYLANERTFLAWIRTSIAVIGLGFVVVKFEMFLIQISTVMKGNPIHIQGKIYSGHLGVWLVLVGLCTVCYAFYQYWLRDRQLRNGKVEATRLPALFLSFSILIVGLILFYYLLNSIQSGN